MQSNFKAQALRFVIVNSARNKDQKLIGCFFFKIGYFLFTDCCPIEKVQEIWETKMDFGQPNTETSRKMANGQWLFPAQVNSTVVQEILV